MSLYVDRAGSRTCMERHVTSSAGRSWRCTCLSCICSYAPFPDTATSYCWRDLSPTLHWFLTAALLRGIGKVWARKQSRSMGLMSSRIEQAIFLQLQIDIDVPMTELQEPCSEGSYVVVTVHLMYCRLRGMPGWLLVGQVASKSGKCCLRHLDNLH